MEMSEPEQRLRLSSTVISVEEYWEYRLGSSAIWVCLAVIEQILTPTLHSRQNNLQTLQDFVDVANELISAFRGTRCSFRAPSSRIRT